jgi:hypothetical protein
MFINQEYAVVFDCGWRFHLMKPKLSTCQFIVIVNRVFVYLLNVNRVRNFVCAIRIGLVSEMKENEIEMYVAGTGAMRTAGLEGTGPLGGQY